MGLGYPRTINSMIYRIRVLLRQVRDFRRASLLRVVLLPSKAVGIEEGGGVVVAEIVVVRAGVLESCRDPIMCGIMMPLAEGEGVVRVAAASLRNRNPRPLALRVVVTNRPLALGVVANRMSPGECWERIIARKTVIIRPGSKPKLLLLPLWRLGTTFVLP